MTATLTRAVVLAALRGVDDPEYPGVSIVDLGLVEHVHVDGDGDGDGESDAHGEHGRVTVELIPTYLGCPALDYIVDDVRTTLRELGEHDAVVRFVDTPVWSPSRISDAGREALARDFTVAVQLGRQPTSCPRCGAAAIVTTSPFGSMRCRSVADCHSCGEHLELIR